jgi:hypothetical protein
MLGKAQEILDGWKALVWKDPERERLAQYRSLHCGICEHLSTTAKYYLYCNRCGCYIPAKVRAIGSKCPINKW